MQYFINSTTKNLVLLIHDVSGSIKCVCFVHLSNIQDDLLGSIPNVPLFYHAILYFNSLCATVNLKVHISQINPPDTLPISLTKGARSSGVFREQDKADVHEAKKIWNSNQQTSSLCISRPPPAARALCKFLLKNELLECEWKFA